MEIFFFRHESGLKPSGTLNFGKDLEFWALSFEKSLSFFKNAQKTPGIEDDESHHSVDSVFVWCVFLVKVDCNVSGLE